MAYGLQVLDFHEGEVERIGVDHIVLDALFARVRDMALQGRGARGPARLLEQEVAVEHGHDDIVGLVPMPARFRARREPPLGHPNMRLRDMDMGHGFRS
jgi:hypothetical protein